MIDDVKKTSAKERGKRLRLVRKMSNMTLNELASKYGIGTSTVKYWECAKNRGLSAKGAKKIIAALQLEGIQCSYMWLMYGIGLPPQFVDVRFGDAKALIAADLSNYEEEKSIELELTLFCSNVPNAIALTIFDDGMEPFYCSGDSIGGKRLYGQDLAQAIGKNCIIETVDRQLLCRRLAQGNGSDSFNLYCINPNATTNPPHHYDTQILSAAPITRVWKRSA